MDIELPMTPPKKDKRIIDDYSTPTKKQNRKMCYETPPKKTLYQRPEKQKNSDLYTPVKGQNPQSKKQNYKTKRLTNKMNTPRDSERKKKVTEFQLSRIDQDYQFVKNLGQGNFSRVGLYKSHMTEELFAIKITRLSSMSVNQAQALGTLSIFNNKSKNLVKYFYSWIQNNELFLVMQHCSHTLTSLFNQYRKSSRAICEKTLKQILRQALQGLKIMHENKMVHLDIKPDNLLFSSTFKQNSDFTLKISDLGLTRISKLRRQGDINEGDSRYLAKQVLNYTQNVDLTKSDIFSLGMTIYEGMSLENLPNNGSQWQKIRTQGLYLTSRMDLQQYSQSFLEIIQLMTKVQWQQRPSASQILQLQYFKQNSLKKTDFRHHALLSRVNQTKARRECDRKNQASL